VKDDPVLFLPPIEVSSGVSAPFVTSIPLSSVTAVGDPTPSSLPAVGTVEGEEIEWLDAGVADDVARPPCNACGCTEISTPAFLAVPKSDLCAPF
jgi:hypothetical protein